MRTLIVQIINYYYYNTYPIKVDLTI